MFTHNKLPNFIREGTTNCVFFDILRWKKQRTCLALTKQLKFFEFAGKQTLRCFDLHQTVLRDESSRLQRYDGPKNRGTIKHAEITDDTSTSTSSRIPAEDAQNESRNELGSSELNFGRYTNRNKELYILLQCWDKLLVFRHPGNMLPVDYSLVAEYTNVIGYHLIHDGMKYHALVKIAFKSGKILCTDFQSERSASSSTDGGAVATTTSEFKRFMSKIVAPRSELLLHRAITQSEFVRTSNRRIFGSGSSWPAVLEEKQQLTRCGDIWIRFTAHDSLVVGVTLQNITAAVAYKLQIFQLDATTNMRRYSTNYKQRIFETHCQLKIKENELAQYFDCLDEGITSIKWQENCGQKLVAYGSVVLLTMIPLGDIVNEELLHLFVRYEVQKSMCQLASNEIGPTTTKKFSQQLYLGCLSMDELMRNHQLCAITFNDLNVHQDYLAVLMSQKAACDLQLVCISKGDYALLMALLVDRLQFDECETGSSKHNPVIDDHAIGVNNARMDDTQSRVCYWNRQPMSEWHDTLLVRELCDGDPICNCKIYAPSEIKLKLLLRILFELFLEHKLIICDVQLGTLNDTTNVCMSPIRFKCAIQQELNAWREHISPNNCRPQLDYTMMTSLKRNDRQLESDLLAILI